MAQSNQEKNQLRLAIDIKSLKEHEFTAQMYIAYKPIPELGIKNFRSAPTQAITNPRAQIQINNCFRSYMFDANRTQLKEKMNQGLNLELWHNDRIKKDVLLGIVKLQFDQVLTQPFRKTKQSYAVVYDVILPIDEVDQSQNPIRKVGALRVVVYLEDLGPLSRLKQKGFDIKNFVDDYDIPEGNIEPDRPILPSQNDKFASLEEKQRIQLNDLEHKVVWQLQVWKKAEQNRTRMVLKQKEVEFWTNLSQQQRKSDLQKQKQFKKIQANLGLLQNKLKAKIKQLQKRQSKIIVYQQQLQSKINEVSRQIFLKDEEIERIKKRHKDQKTIIIKQKANLDIQIQKLNRQNARLKIQLQESKKEDQKAPINILKSEIQHKKFQIRKLQQELQKCMEVKQEYKIYFQKMRDQVIQQKALLKEKQEQLLSNNSETMILRNNMKHLEQKIRIIERQNYQQQYYQPDYEDQEPPVYSNKKQKLIRQRKGLIQQGYQPNDPLVQQYDRNIAAIN